MSENNQNDKDKNIDETNESKKLTEENNESINSGENEIQESKKSAEGDLISESEENTNKNNAVDNDSNNDEDITNSNESTNVELDENGEEIEVIYKKERNPIIKFFIGFIAFIVIAYVTLFAVGFTMGLMKIQPPNIDEGVLTNKWGELTGGENTEPPSELEPATEKPTDNKSDNGGEQNEDDVDRIGEIYPTKEKEPVSENS